MSECEMKTPFNIFIWFKESKYMEHWKINS